MLDNPEKTTQPRWMGVPVLYHILYTTFAIISSLASKKRYIFRLCMNIIYPDCKILLYLRREHVRDTTECTKILYVCYEQLELRTVPVILASIDDTLQILYSVVWERNLASSTSVEMYCLWLLKIPFLLNAWNTYARSMWIIWIDVLAGERRRLR